MLDHGARVGVFWTASAERVPRYERAAPLRAILDWWGGHHGCRVVHAGAVGTEQRRGAARRQGGVGEIDGGARVPRLGALVRRRRRRGGERGSETVSSTASTARRSSSPTISAARCRTSCPCSGTARRHTWASACSSSTAITRRSWPRAFPCGPCCCRASTTAERCTTRPVSSSAALVALAPSTLFQLPGARQQRLHHMAEILRRVPAYALDLGSDLTTVAPAIRAVLA